MRLHFERSGGFAGLLIKVTVDTADLPGDKKTGWKRALTEAGFFELPSNLAGETGPDSFVYELTAVTAEKEHAVRFSAGNVPEELRPLFRELTIMARQR